MPLPVVVTSFCWAFVFGYFALGYTTDPESCYASDDSNFINVAKVNDVGEKFRIVFIILFYTNVA